MDTARLTGIPNAAFDRLQPILCPASRSPRPLASIALAGIVYSLGLNWLMNEGPRRRQRAELHDLARRRPASSALTFALVYLCATGLTMVALMGLSLAVVALAGAWSSQFAVMAGAAGVVTRMLLVLRSLWQG